MTVAPRYPKRCYPALCRRKHTPSVGRIGVRIGRISMAFTGQEPAVRERILQTMVTVSHVEQLERFLLRRGVGALEADRHRCADCGRTPLTGEHVHLYESPPSRPHRSPGRAHGIVCELCRPLRRDAPVATEIVRHCEHGHTVRLTVRAA
jgi:hypothetical protein